MAGFRYHFSPIFRAGLISYHARDYINVHYAEIDGAYQMFNQSKLQYYFQYMLEDSIGKEQGGEIDTSAWGLRLIYNFSRMGLKGLTAQIKTVDGNTPDRGRIASSDQTEVNYDLQYVFQTNKIEGVSIRMRYADVNRNSYLSESEGHSEGIDVDQFRIIVNYEARF